MLVNINSSDKNRIVEVKSSNDPTISFRIMFNAGAQNDPAGKEGMAYITSEMISDGATKVNSYEQVLEKLFPIAASISVQCGREIVVVSGRIHKDNLKVYYDLFTQQVLTPAFNEDDFARIKANTLSYLKNTLKYSSDEELGKALLYNTVYSGTAYAHPEQGTESGVNSITLNDVKSFYAKYYNRNNFVLGIGGGYDNTLTENLWTDLQKLNDGQVVIPVEIKAAKVSGRNLVVLNKSANATAISMGYPISIVRGTREWYALAVANSWFGEHRNSSSHLYQVIREQRGLNYGDYSYIEHYPNGGRLNKPPVNVPRRQHMFEVWIRPVPNETAHFALRAAVRELDLLIKNGLNKEDFELTRNFLKKYILHYAPTISKRLGYALDDKFYGLNKSHLQMFGEALSTMTLDEVNAAIKKYLQSENLAIAVIAKDGDKLMKNIVEDLESPITYSTPKESSVIEEDKSIIKYPLKISAKKAKLVELDKIF